MTDDMKTNEQTSSSEAADETFAWSAEPEATAGSDRAREWLAQLQAMIENLATQAAPVVREVGAKAAELAAAAGDKAGPVAQRAAAFTGQAGQKLAERSRDFAAELRKDQAADDGAAIEAGADEAKVTADEPPTTAGVA